MVRTSGAGSSVVLAPRTRLPAIWRFISRTPLTSWSKCRLSIFNVLHQLGQRIDLLARQISLLVLNISLNKEIQFSRHRPVGDTPRPPPLAPPFGAPPQLPQTETAWY